jgi:alcohol dehydrogenase, propanol-preferring
MGGLGFYATQYARILDCGANVVAFDRDENKLQLAKEIGADFTVSVNKSLDIRNEISRITKGNGIDVVLDTVGLESTLNLAGTVLNKMLQ